MQVTLQLVAAAGADALLDLMREFYEGEGWPFAEAAARAAVLGLLAEPHFGSAWFIRADEAVAGYVVLTIGYSLELHGRDAFVDELYVRPLHRRQGLGTRALAFVEEECRSRGVRALHLEVGRDNVRAQSLYRQAGFEDRPHFLMTKRLPPASRAP